MIDWRGAVATGVAMATLAVGSGCPRMVSPTDSSVGPTDTGQSEDIDSGGTAGDTGGTDSAQPDTGPNPWANRVWTQVSAGGSSTCGLTDTGEIHCTGTVGPPPPGAGWLEVEVEGGSACAIAADHTATCWGAPVVVNSVPTVAVRGLAMRATFVCAVRVSVGLPVCWGYRRTASVPLEEALQVKPAYAVCVLGVDGDVSCAGIPDPGPSEQYDQEPEGVFTTIGMNGDGGCGLRGGEVVCWGDHSDFPRVQSQIPAGAFVELGINHGAACAVDSAGDARCWGDFPSFFWDEAPSDEQLHGLSVSINYACAIATLSGGVVCWGDPLHTPAFP